MNKTKWIYGGLVAFSVLLNLFFITRTATFYLRAHEMRAEQSPCAKLEPATQDALFKVLGKERKALKEKRSVLHKAHRNVLKALKAEPFDEAAMTAAISEIEGVLADGMHRFNTAILEFSKTLPQEERQKLACVVKFRALGGKMNGGHYGMPPFTKREFSHEKKRVQAPTTERMWMNFDNEILGRFSR